MAAPLGVRLSTIDKLAFKVLPLSSFAPRWPHESFFSIYGLWSRQRLLILLSLLYFCSAQDSPRLQTAYDRPSLTSRRFLQEQSIVQIESLIGEPLEIPDLVKSVSHNHVSMVPMREIME